MKTKFYWVALLASAAMIAQANAGGHHGGGGGGGAGMAMAGGRGGGGSFYHAMPMQSYGGGRMMYSGQRFSSVGMRSPSFSYRQSYMNAYRGAPIGARGFTRGNINNHVNGGTRFANGRTGAGQFRNGNHLPSNWRNHVVAQHSSNWHRDWDRGRDHFWHGHRCRFVNGSWFIFDLGFYPWWYDGYPYDYYGYDYYPYGYDPGYYDSGADQGEPYYDQNNYNSPEQYTDSTIATAQQRLAQQGYYRGEFDGILGPETRRAIARYQSDHGLRVTGYLTTDTLQALGLPRVASN